MRTEVARAVKCDKPGLNPFVLCFLEHHLCDPQLYVTFETLRDFRSLDPVHGMHALGASAAGETHLEWNSLHEILLQRLHQLDFHVLPDGRVLDSFGPCDFSRCSFSELVFRVLRQWHCVLSSLLQNRPTFRDFSQVDTVGTKLAFRTYSSFDQGVLRRWLSGAFQANNVAWRWSEDGSTACPQCGQLDSPDHRLWHCTASQTLRQSFDPAVLASLRSCPDVCRLHGWTLASPFEQQWLEYLAMLPCLPGFHVVPLCPGRLELFTDGSCHVQADPRCRVASFAVVYSPGIQDAPSVGQLFPICAQPLGGLLQVAYRAELMAIVAAVQYAIRIRRPARIWSDCSGVVARFQAHFVRKVPVRHSQAHSDLWFELRDLLTDLPEDFILVCKVAAHTSEDAADTDLDVWLRQGNSAADTAAKAANSSRPDWVWKLWQNMVHDQWELGRQGQEMRRLILGVTEIWGEKQSKPQEASLAPQPTRVTREFEVRWCSDGGLTLRKPTFKRLFGERFAEVVREWLASVISSDSPIRWISFVQLYLSFQLRCKPISVLNKGRKWRVVFGVEARLQNHVPFLTRVKAFRLMLQQYLKDAGIDYRTATLRPDSEFVACHRGSLSLPFDQVVWRSVEQCLCTQLSVPSNGQGKALASLVDP